MLAPAAVGARLPAGRVCYQYRLMSRGRIILTLLVALLVMVAVPTVAVAQSAGEDQYTDPLGGGNSGHSGGGGNSGSGGNSGASNNAPAQPAQSTQTQAAPAQTAAPKATAAQSSGLPRTGFPVVLLVLAGGTLLAGGLALRRVT
jgi:hypothetical protein